MDFVECIRAHTLGLISSRFVTLYITVKVAMIQKKLLGRKDSYIVVLSSVCIRARHFCPIPYPHARCHTTLSIRLRLFFAALFPAIQFKERALIAFPWEFLGTDGHVFGERTIGTVVVFFNGGVLHHHQNASGASDKDGNLDPDP